MAEPHPKPSLVAPGVSATIASSASSEGIAPMGGMAGLYRDQAIGAGRQDAVDESLWLGRVALSLLGFPWMPMACDLAGFVTGGNAARGDDGVAGRLRERPLAGSFNPMRDVGKGGRP